MEDKVTRLRMFRQRAGITQTALAEAVGIAGPALSMAEHGRYASRKTITVLAAYLGVSEAGLLETPTAQEYEEYVLAKEAGLRTASGSSSVPPPPALYERILLHRLREAEAKGR